MKLLSVDKIPKGERKKLGEYVDAVSFVEVVMRPFDLIFPTCGLPRSIKLHGDDAQLE